MSMGELLKRITNQNFNMENIHFQLDCFEVQNPNNQNSTSTLNKTALKNLAMHLDPQNPYSHGSAVGLLKPRRRVNTLQSDVGAKVGHAISMYKFCTNEKYFCYKDSSAKEYLSSENVPEELTIERDEYYRIYKAWTFSAIDISAIDM